jgi:hypothetical protein
VRWLRLLAAELRWVYDRAGYWLRPYDMLADARRWRWQARYPCQWGDGQDAVLARWREEGRWPAGGRRGAAAERPSGLAQRMVAEYARLDREAIGAFPMVGGNALDVMAALERVVRDAVAAEVEAERDEKVVHGCTDPFASGMTWAARVACGDQGTVGERWKVAHPVHEAGSGPGG